MKRIGIIFLICVFLFSCESQQEKDIKIAIDQKKERIMQNKIDLERKLLEEKRQAEKQRLQEIDDSEQEFYDSLLSDNLLNDSINNNKNALLLLDKKGSEDDIYSEDEYDLESDSSLQKYVNNEIAFKDIQYVPENLVRLRGEYMNDTKGNSELRMEAYEALDNLSQNFFLQFDKKLTIVSAYRSYQYQKGIKQRGCSDNLCAKAGYSEHQSGLAVDLWEASELKRFEEDGDLQAYFEWMNLYAHKYGFTNTYQKGKEMDGYEKEPWHWRYVGIELATYLRKNNESFAEFYYSKG